jgi:hypothetical protein
MQGIYQKEKREKQRRAWTRLITGIPNKLLSLPMPKVILTILTRLSDVWHTYKQIWYVPFIWSFAWYSYWIIFDIAVWNKPLAQLNLLNCIGATTSAIFILAASPIRRRLQKGVVFAKTAFLSASKEREGTRELSRLQTKVTTLEQEKETLNSRLISIGNELSFTKEQLKSAPTPEYVKTLENRNLDLTTTLQEPQALQSSDTGWTRRATKESQAKPQTQQPSSPVSSTLPSFDCPRQNGIYGGMDQCLICPNLIDCTYRRNKSSEL